MIKITTTLLCLVLSFNSLLSMEDQAKLKEQIVYTKQKQSFTNTFPSTIGNLEMSQSVTVEEIKRYSYEKESACCAPIHLFMRTQIICADAIMQLLKKMDKQD